MKLCNRILKEKVDFWVVGECILASVLARCPIGFSEKKKARAPRRCLTEVLNILGSVVDDDDNDVATLVKTRGALQITGFIDARARGATTSRRVYLQCPLLSSCVCGRIKYSRAYTEAAR